MHKCLIPLFAFLLLLACGRAEKEAEAGAEPGGQITLIFQQAPDNTAFHFADGATYSTGVPLQYLDNKGILRRLDLHYAPENDTLLISLQQEWLEVAYTAQGPDQYSYLLHRGDSVLFTFAGGQPQARLLNRNAAPLELNYELYKRTKISGGDIPAAVKYLSGLAYLFYPAQSGDPLDQTYAQSEQQAAAIAVRELDREQQLLDSLQAQEALSAGALSFYRQKNQYQQLEIRLRQGVLPAAELRSALAQQHDSLLQFLFYHSFLKSTASQLYWSTPGQQGRSQSQSLQAVYDSVSGSPLYSPAARKALQLEYMKRIAEQASPEQALAHLERFRRDVQDEALVDYITTTFKLDAPATTDLLLIGLNQQQYSLAEVLQQQRGKLVYVDFWASWCRPCLAAMPASKSLQQEFSGQAVAFIYLSLDENAEQWRRAAKKEGMDQAGIHSYLVQNTRTAVLLQELEIRSIPRYMLYGQDGTLLHKNAPGPQGPGIRALLKKHLSEGN